MGLKGNFKFTIVEDGLRELGIDVPEEFALFPPLILDRISADWMLEEDGNHLLAHYSQRSRLL